MNPAKSWNDRCTLLRSIFEAGVEAVDPVRAVRRHLKRNGSDLVAGSARWSLEKIDRVYVVGAGKASAAMASAVVEIVGDRLSGGVVNTKYGHAASVDRVKICEAGHPVPDENGMRGASEIAEIASNAEARDLVICCLSGGGSALLPLPAEGVSLEDKMETTRLLLGSGADIEEINAVRKHLSRIKGGNLARFASPASVLTLILSDVVGDRLDTIASGPTVPDRTTFRDCLEILDRRKLTSAVPGAALKVLKAGADGKRAETPKPGDSAFSQARCILIGNNRQAIQAAAARAREAGYRPLVLSTTIEGETRDIARMHGAIAREVVESGSPVKPPCCLLSGGETTVTLKGDGLGGRNQEFALAAAIEIEGLDRVSVLCAGTDGTDGPTDAAGAFADGGTCSRARQEGLEPVEFLDRNDSYHFFEPLGDLLKTGPTRTNVMDLRIILVDG